VKKYITYGLGAVAGAGGGYLAFRVLRPEYKKLQVPASTPAAQLVNQYGYMNVINSTMKAVKQWDVNQISQPDLDAVTTKTVDLVHQLRALLEKTREGIKSDAWLLGAVTVWMAWYYLEELDTQISLLKVVDEGVWGGEGSAYTKKAHQEDILVVLETCRSSYTTWTKYQASFLHKVLSLVDAVFDALGAVFDLVVAIAKAIGKTIHIIAAAVSWLPWVIVGVVGVVGGGAIMSWLRPNPEKQKKMLKQ